MTVDDDNDSFLRAIAAAPAATPVRTLTAMVVRAGADIALADQWSLVRARIGSHAEIDERDRILVITWSGADHAPRAATCALELREAVAGLAIALATGSVEPRAPITPIVDRAIALLDPTAIRIDDETAERVSQGFSLQRAPGKPIALVEPLATGTPARIDHTVGNYRIVRMLGSGGMGVVYLAEHVTLGRKAVVKFVRERLMQSEEFSARFFSEAKLAASIHHPGIVDVFDYGQDDRGHGYIVMEYLDGESLRARLRRDSQLPVELAVAIAKQVANALGAAHAAGVIHRDLKPDNIFLVRDTDSAHRVRAKVLDFGLAKLADPAERGLTQSGNFIGTPLYMSPEQCRGKQVDARTDVYSLGCILFEMTCGRPPFVDDTVGDLIIAHNSTPPPSPRALVPALPPELDTAIVRALAKTPADRFADMAAFTSALAIVESNPAASIAHARTSKAAIDTPPSVAVRRRIRRAPIIAALAAVAVAGAVVIAMRVRSHPTDKIPPPAPNEHRSIAVIDPRDNSGGTDSAWLSTALGEIVTTNLLASPQLTVAPSTDVARMRADLGIGDATTWSTEQLAKVHTDLGVDYVIAGAYRANGSTIDIDVDIYDTATGHTVASAKANGASSDPNAIGVHLANEVERAFGIEPNPTATPPVLPTKPSAARFYAEGLARLRRFEIGPARELLQRAAGEDPDDPLVHAALAEAWRAQGYDAKAAVEAKLAYEHAGQLPKESRTAIEAAYFASLQQWDKAIEAYRTLVEFFPKRIDYGIALAQAQTNSGDAKSAYATLETLRKVPELANDPRIENTDAEAAEAADDAERERTHAELAVKLARSRGARGLLATALFHYGWASWILGHDAEAKAAYEEARAIFTALHDRSGLARCLSNIGLAAHRDRRDADATKAFDEGLRVATEIGDTTAQAWILQNWGFVLGDLGDLPRALELANKKLELGGERGDSATSQAGAHADIAEILRWTGDLAGAKSHAKTADDLLRGVDERVFAAFTNDQLGEIARAEDDLAGARKLLGQCIQWSTQSKHLTPAAECRISLARTELDAGDPVAAEKAARDALSDLREAKDSRLQACAVSLIATSLLARDRTVDAAKELAAASTSDATFGCKLDLDVATARVEAADPGQRAARLDTIHELAARAHDHGMIQRELEIRLAAIHLGDDPKPLARDAAAKGFKLVARLAK